MCSQSILGLDPGISRLENLPDRRALLRLGRALVDQYCSSFRTVPKRIVLDIDDTFDRVHGGQQLGLFNAYHDDYGFQPIVVFDGEGRFVSVLLRPGKRPSGVEIRGFVRRLVGAIRAHWPKVEIPGLRRGRLRCAPTVIMRPRKCSTGAGRTGSIGSSVWPPTWRSAAMSWHWRKARPNASG